MPITNPYHRIWRPVKGYKQLGEMFAEPGTKVPTIDYLCDDKYACQAERQSLVTTAHLIMRDLYEVFNYVEPHEHNFSVYSHRIYELFLRTATEFEANCKCILLANGYAKKEKAINSEDYFKVSKAARLSEYKVVFLRWVTDKEFMPFSEWNGTEYTPLTWYQDYNSVKHNRYDKFALANFGNLMNAVAGLLCILHAQYGEFMDKASFEGFGISQSKQEIVSNDTFIIYAPHFNDEEQYSFIWKDIKRDHNPIINFPF